MKDLKTEAWLDGLQVDWVYLEDVQISEIESKAPTSSHQVRFELIDKENLNKITKAKRQGVDFTAPVLNLTEDGYTILDGYHRINADLSLKTKITDAYVVSVEETDKVYYSLMLEPNSKLTSKPLSDAEISWWSIYMHENYGLAHKVIAEELGIQTSRVSTAINIHKAANRMERLVGSLQAQRAWHELPNASKLTLNRINSDIALKAAVEAVVRSRLNSKQIQELLGLVNEAGTDAGAVKAVKDYVESIKASKKRKRNPNRAEWMHVVMHSAAISNADVVKFEKDMNNGTLTAAKVREIQTVMARASSHLNKLSKIKVENLADTPTRAKAAPKTTRTSRKRPAKRAAGA